MADEDAVEAIYRSALQELEPDGDEPLSKADHERVRAYIQARYRPGLSAPESAALQEAAVQDLLQALEFATPVAGPDPKLVEALQREIRALGEVITRVRQDRATAGRS
jgi:hypothetical protein